MLNREQILGRKPQRQQIEVPEWGGAVTIQALTVAAAQAVSSGTEDGIVELVLACVINDDGTPMFSPEDKDALRRLDFAGSKRVADAAMALNAMSKTSVEELAKNSETGLNGASSSA